ncbi:MAG TPA: hypothetical protein VN688_34595 [Gemmataceae bacterium]|nr:hypothetical protein [Gemmataceae bacterium]
MFRLRFVASMLVVGLLTSGFLMGEDKKTDKEPIFIKARLPAGFSKLGLNQKQKNDIYKIRAKYSVRIDELKQQIAALQKKEMSDVEEVLSAGQKTLLKEIRSGGSKTTEIKENPTESKKK